MEIQLDVYAIDTMKSSVYAIDIFKISAGTILDIM